MVSTPKIKYKQPVSILAIIHDQDKNILLLNRKDIPEYWQSVTGSQEQEDSTIEQTAHREIWEETGIKPHLFHLHNWHYSSDYLIYEHWRHRYSPGTLYNKEHVFSLCIPSDTAIKLQEKEHIAYQWLPLAEAAQKVFSPSNQEAILKLPENGCFDV